MTTEKQVRILYDELASTYQYMGWDELQAKCDELKRLIADAGFPGQMDTDLELLRIDGIKRAGERGGGEAIGRNI